MQLDTLIAQGQPPMQGSVFIFTPEDADEALAAITEIWRDTLPEASFWRDEAPDARWYGAFAPEVQGNFAEPPPSEGLRFALSLNGQEYPGQVLNETRTPGEPFHQRYLIAGEGVPPEPPVD